MVSVAATAAARALCDADFACQAETKILLKMNYFIVAVAVSAAVAVAALLERIVCATNWQPRDSFEMRA